ncbi:unnamed protein product [marine sediment metagenome]|uniref:Uncharacterized protein n=1 Tax=marine sediment metagenome TaxID=412755 RepID=X1F003_9ZZZZ
MRKYYPTPELVSTTEIDFLNKQHITTKDEVHAALVDLPEGLTKKELAEYLGYDSQNTSAVRRIERALETLLREEKITYSD